MCFEIERIFIPHSHSSANRTKHIIAFVCVPIKPHTLPYAIRSQTRDSLSVHTHQKYMRILNRDHVKDRATHWSRSVGCDIATWHARASQYRIYAIKHTFYYIWSAHKHTISLIKCRSWNKHICCAQKIGIWRVVCQRTIAGARTMYLFNAIHN